MNFVDLFSGAGGLSEGFIKAGFRPLAHVEIDGAACKTLQTRLAFHSLEKKNRLDDYYSYLKGAVQRYEFINEVLSPREINSVLNIPIGGRNNKLIFDQIENLKGRKPIDVLVGGPPCQAYSLVGRARDKKNMKEDPRNFLYREYGKFLNHFQPKVFVFENVIGLLTAEKGLYLRNMKKYFKTVGYELDWRVLNSEDFGVLQKRRRVVLIGWKKGMEFKYPAFMSKTSNFTVQEIFNDLAPLKAGDLNNLSSYSSLSNDYLSKYKLRNGSEFVTQHIARPHNERDLEIYRIAVEKHMNGERLLYTDLPSKLKTHRNQISFLDRFKVVDSRGLSHTLVAHIAKDGHHFIHPSLEQNRSISVREAARIQSFADDYYFEGGRTASFRQIGNAVPPLMAKQIAFQIKKQLQ